MFSSLNLKCVTETPYAKDVRDGGVFGVFSAGLRGIERERLKLHMSALEEKYKKDRNDQNSVVRKQEVLDEFDKFGATLNYKDLVTTIRDRLINHINDIDRQSQSIASVQSVQLTTSSQSVQTMPEEELELESLYVLELENGKYFVGSTENVIACMEQHQDGTFCDFTAVNKPIKVIEQRQMISRFNENALVQEYMAKYGVANVRGGSHVSNKMSASEVVYLQKDIMYATNKRITFGEDFNLDSTDVATFVMHDFGKFSVEEIAEMRGLQESTVLIHLERCKQFNVAIV